MPLLAKNPLVSIIIRTRNEERWIGFCLDAILKQSYKNYEIILVDNNSSDQTISKANKYGVQLVKIDEFLPGKAINQGIRESKGEVIVIISGHCIPVDGSWLENLIAGLDDADVAGVYGRQEALSFTSALDKRDLAITFGLDRRVQLRDSFFHNANSALRRDTWERFPFDETVTNIEDRVWGVKVIEAGLKIIYEPSASVYHHHGIHHGRDVRRAEKIVRIMENLHGPHVDMVEISEGVARIVAIIPVRGKSLHYEDETLLEKTIEYLKRCKSLTEIIVSTDCHETAELARKSGASVPFMRPKELSEKYVDISQVLAYSINELESLTGVVDLVVIVEETYQFRDPAMIDEMVYQALSNSLDTVIAVKEESRSLWLEKNGDVERLGLHTFLPRDLREDHSYISLMGLGCVTRPNPVREGAIFGQKIGLHSVHNQLAETEIRTQEVLNLYKPLLQNYFENFNF